MRNYPELKITNQIMIKGVIQPGYYTDEEIHQMLVKKFNNREVKNV